MTVTAAAIPIVRSAMWMYGPLVSTSWRKLVSVQWWTVLPVNESVPQNAEMNRTTSEAT